MASAASRPEEQGQDDQLELSSAPRARKASIVADRRRGGRRRPGWRRGSSRAAVPGRCRRRRGRASRRTSEASTRRSGRPRPALVVERGLERRATHERRLAALEELRMPWLSPRRRPGRRSAPPAAWRRDVAVGAHAHAGADLHGVHPLPESVYFGEVEPIATSRHGRHAEPAHPPGVHARAPAPDRGARRGARPPRRARARPHADRRARWTGSRLAEAAALDYAPRAGMPLGPLWATWWLRVEATRAARLGGRAGRPAAGDHTEATLWLDGARGPGPGQRPRVRRAPTRRCRARARRRAARARASRSPATARSAGSSSARAARAPALGRARRSCSTRCELARFDPDAWALAHDFAVLRGAEHEPASTPPGAASCCAELNRFCNAWDAGGPRDLAGRRARDPRRAATSATTATRPHELSAVGHAHLDTAWLWPLEETYRKCVRTFATQLRLMERLPRATASPARRPSSTRGSATRARRSGRGSASASPPGSGCRSAARGSSPTATCPRASRSCASSCTASASSSASSAAARTEFWNPDVFGYNGQLPQLMRGAGIDRFLTQKLSWNRFNPPEHHTFRWQGIDGSEVLAHFPPADTYNAEATVAELRRSGARLQGPRPLARSLLVFGHGDGGGGPTPRRCSSACAARATSRACRARRMRRPRGVLRRARGGARRAGRTVVGELYFEYHRGTYTTPGAHQARQPRAARRAARRRAARRASPPARARAVPARGARAGVAARCCSTSSTTSSRAPRSPRSTRARGRDLADGRGARRRARAMRRWPRSAARRPGRCPSTRSAWRAARWSRRPARPRASPRRRRAASGGSVDARRRRRASSDAGRRRRARERAPARDARRATARCARSSHRATGREALAAPGNVLELYEDRPTAWDAWDLDPFHLETRARLPAGRRACAVVRAEPLRAEVVFERPVGARAAAAPDRAPRRRRARASSSTATSTGTRTTGC